MAKTKTVKSAPALKSTSADGTFRAILTLTNDERIEIALHTQYNFFSLKHVKGDNIYTGDGQLTVEGE